MSGKQETHKTGEDAEKKVINALKVIIVFDKDTARISRMMLKSRKVMEEK